MEYESSVSEVDEVTREIKVSVSVGEVNALIEKSLGDLVKKAAIKGFRPGKAPRTIVEKVYGGRVRADVIQDLISTSLNEIAKKNKLNIVGDPEIDVSSGVTEGSPLTYSAKVSLFPAPAISGYEKLKVKVENVEVTDDAVEKVIEKLRSSRATMRKLEFRNTAKKGDVIDVLVAVERAGEEKGRPEPVVVPLGEGNLPKEVEDAIEGLEVGSSKDIVHAEKSANGSEKSTTYHITLNSLYEKVLPELTDEFVKGLSLDVQTVLELRIKVREELGEETERQKKTNVHSEIIDQLVSSNQFRVPQVLIDEELRSLLLRSGIIPADKVENIDLEPFRGELADVALKRVRGAIVLDRISELENIKVESEELNKEMADLAEKSGASVDQVKEMLSKSGRFVSFVMELTRNKVLEHLVSRSEVEYV